MMARLFLIILLAVGATSVRAAAPIRLTESYSTHGHPKAQGLDIIMSYPAGWSRREGQHPHIVQTFIAAEPRGTNCNLGVREHGIISPVEWSRTIADPTFVADALPSGMREVARRTTTMDGLPALMLTGSGTFSSGGLSADMTMTMYMTSYGRYFVTLTCTMVMREQSSEEDVRQQQLLFGRIANSILIRDRSRRR